jgi:hypothetical protein
MVAGLAVCVVEGMTSANAIIGNIVADMARIDRQLPMKSSFRPSLNRPVGETRSWPEIEELLQSRHHAKFRYH